MAETNIRNDSNGDGGQRPDSRSARLGLWLQNNWGALLSIILIIIGVFWIGSTVLRNPLILSDLRDQAYARGVITLLITIVTMVMAFLLIIQAFTNKDPDADKRFSRAREVFTVLMGVLGTIVGFYFGSTENNLDKLDVAKIIIADQHLLTHVSGGTLPYRYSIQSSDDSFKKITNKISEDGWIDEPLEKPLAEGATITIDVIDGKDLKISKNQAVEPSANPPQPPD